MNCQTALTFFDRKLWNLIDKFKLYSDRGVQKPDEAFLAGCGCASCDKSSKCSCQDGEEGYTPEVIVLAYYWGIA